MPSCALLNWSHEHLASNIASCESYDRQFRGRAGTPYDRTVADIQRALEAAGVEFTNGDEPAVKLKAKPKAKPKGK
jgi:hypothetical protein